jgi:hypothetical protein
MAGWEAGRGNAAGTTTSYHIAELRSGEVGFISRRYADLRESG